MKKLTDFRGSDFDSGPTYTDDNLFSQDFLEVVLGISEGPIKGIADDQLYNCFVNDTPIVSQGGTNNFEVSDLRISYTKGDYPDATVGQFPLYLEGTAQFQSVGAQLNYNVPIVRQIIASELTDIGALQLHFDLQRLLRSDEDGTHTTKLELVLQYRLTGDTAWKTLANNDDGQPTVYQFSGKTTSGYKREVRVQKPVREAKLAGKGIDLQITRQSPDSDDNYIAECVWLGYELVAETDGLVPLHEDLAQVHIFAASTDQLSGSLNFSAVWDGLMVPVPSNYDPVNRTYDETSPWDGTFTTTRHWTDNPIWLAYELSMNGRFGVAAHNPFVQLDRYAWYEQAKYCDEMVPDGEGGQQPRYTFNGVLNDSVDGLDLINAVLASCFAAVYEDELGNLVLIADRPDSLTYIITPETVEEVEGIRFTYQYSDPATRYNSLRGQFLNPNKDWENDFVEVKSQTDIDQYGLINKDVTLNGCTNAHEARRKLTMMLTSGLTETMTVSFTTTRLGLLLEPFTLIGVADPTRNWALTGRALQVTTSQITLRDPIYIEEAGLHTIKVQTHTGVLEKDISLSVGSYTTFNVPGFCTTEQLDTIPGKPVVAVESTTETGLIKPFRVLRCDPVDITRGKWAVSAVEVNRNKYDGADNCEFVDIDLYGFKKPEKPVAVTSLTLSLDREIVGLGLRTHLHMQWDFDGSGTYRVLHTIYVAHNGERFQLIGTTRGQEYVLRNIDVGEYRVYIVTTSLAGQASCPVVGIDNVLPDSWEWSNFPANFDLSIRTEQTKGDIFFYAAATYDENGVLIDLVRENLISSVAYHILADTGGAEVATLSTQTPAIPVLFSLEYQLSLFSPRPTTLYYSVDVVDITGGITNSGELSLVLDPPLSDEYGDLIGSEVAGRFYIWTAYSSSYDGVADFSFVYDELVHLYEGKAFYKTTATPSTDPVDYEWHPILRLETLDDLQAQADAIIQSVLESMIAIEQEGEERRIEVRGPDGSFAAVSHLEQVILGDTGVLAKTLDLVEAQFNSAYGSISELNQVVIGYQQGVVQSIDELTLTMGENTGNITTLTQLTQDIEGRMQGVWGVTVDVNGHVSGISLLENGTTGSLVFDVDQIEFGRLLDDGLTEVKIRPFTITPDGIAHINFADIETADIENLIATYIETETLTVTAKINGGEIDIGNGNFVVTPAGVMTAQEGTFKGTVDAATVTGTTFNGGTINGTTIYGATIYTSDFLYYTAANTTYPQDPDVYISCKSYVYLSFTTGSYVNTTYSELVRLSGFRSYDAVDVITTDRFRWPASPDGWFNLHWYCRGSWSSDRDQCYFIFERVEGSTVTETSAEYNITDIFNNDGNLNGPRSIIAEPFGLKFNITVQGFYDNGDHYVSCDMTGLASTNVFSGDGDIRVKWKFGRKYFMKGVVEASATINLDNDIAP